MKEPCSYADNNPSKEETSAWNSEDSAQLYGIHKWGSDYLGISKSGKVEVLVDSPNGQIGVPIYDIVEGMKERGLEMPVVLRIENLLDDRIKALNEAFNTAIREYDYKNVYRGVFPIKVNQQCHVIEEIAEFGKQYKHGLEAGSKAELIIALSSNRHPDSLIICNGYKDSEFVDLGLFAREIGYPCIFVLETLSELDIILERSEALGVEPMLGVRIRSSIPVDGHWSSDCGEDSIFGLSTVSLIELVRQLKEAGKLHYLQLLHCHLGSQIPNIRNIRDGVEEACQFYRGLVEEGAPMGYLDLGGGLAVDYEGTRSNSTYSMNYQLAEYCTSIVETVCECLNPLGIDHPVLVTESGRATVAYSSMLLFDILNVRNHQPNPMVDSIPKDSHALLNNLLEVCESFDEVHYQEHYNDALYYRDKLRGLFRQGQVSLPERAIADNLCLVVLDKVAACIRNQDSVPAEMANLPAQLADIYYVNFSLFQSLPDIWAIDHVFPIMPIHRLDEKPTREAVIADLTCDCDGKIDRFIIDDEIKPTLKLHPVKDGKDYYLAVFLVGAYQETLGDLHNLFGDTNVVSIFIDEDGSFRYQREFHGDCISDVLEYVEYDPKLLIEQLRKQAEKAVYQGKISASRRKQMMKAFKASFDGYTYFEKENL